MTLTSADLVEDAILPEIMQEGLLSAVFAFDPAAPTVKFMLRVRLPSTSDYAASKLTKSFLVIEVLPEHPGKEADDEARKNTEWLQLSAGSVVSVQLGGLLVSKIVTEDGRRKVYCAAVGERPVAVREHRKVLRKKSRCRKSAAWDYYTPSPPAQQPARRDSRQQLRETSAELSPKLDVRPTGTSGRLTTPLDTPDAPSGSWAAVQAQPVPLGPQRSRSPRPLSTHALQFKSFKRPAEGGGADPEKRPQKRQRFASPQPSAQADPSRPAATSRHPHAARPFPHPNSAGPPPLPPHSAPVTKRLDLGNPASVPAPHDGPTRSYLPSPSTFLSSRDTIESPFATQESRDLGLDELTRPSQTVQPSLLPPQPPLPSALAPEHSHPPARTPPRPRVPPDPPYVPPHRRLSIGTSPVLPPEARPPQVADRSRSSSSAVSDREARRAAMLAELRQMEEEDRAEKLAAERAALLACEVKAHEETARVAKAERVEAERQTARARAEREQRQREEREKYERERKEANRTPDEVKLARPLCETAAALTPRTPRTSTGSDVAQEKRRDSRSASASATRSLQTTPAPTDLRRAAEERIRKANAASLAQRAHEEEKRVAEASRLEEPFTAGKWTYTPLSEIAPGTLRHVMGVVRSVGQPHPTKGGDWSLHLYIRDPTSSKSDDTAVAIFRREAEITRQQFHVGQAVLFRNLKIGNWNGRPKGHAYYTPPSEWYVLLGGKKVVPGGQSQPEPVSQDEITRLKALEAWYREADGISHTPQAGTDAGATRHLVPKLRTLAEASAGHFMDMTVKIMHICILDAYRSAGTNPKYELYVSDGTINPNPTHNFHGIDVGIPPGALMCLTVFSDVNAASERLFKYGAILHFKNVNTNKYKRYGGLELKWADKVTPVQQVEGWNDRRCYIVDPTQPRAIEIEERLKALKEAHTRGEVVVPAPPQPAPIDDAQARPPAPPPVHPISTALVTKYTDEVSHQSSTTAQILDCATVPNRFRLLARVAAIAPRYPKGSKLNAKGSTKVSKGELAVLWCKRCKNNFPDDYCLSCNDKSFKHAEVRWQMLLTLEPEHGTEDCLMAVFDGDDAAAVLPALPPLTPGPNEVARLRRRLAEIKSPVEDLLLGAKFNGEHTRPLIDWTLESYASGPNGRLEYLHFRVFGMRKGD